MVDRFATRTGYSDIILHELAGINSSHVVYEHMGFPAFDSARFRT